MTPVYHKYIVGENKEYITSGHSEYCYKLVPVKLKQSTVQDCEYFDYKGRAYFYAKQAKDITNDKIVCVCPDVFHEETIIFPSDLVVTKLSRDGDWENRYDTLSGLYYVEE